MSGLYSPVPGFVHALAASPGHISGVAIFQLGSPTNTTRRLGFHTTLVIRLLVNCLPYQLYIILFPRCPNPGHEYITPSFSAFQELLLLLAQQTLLLTRVHTLTITILEDKLIILRASTLFPSQHQHILPQHCQH